MPYIAHFRELDLEVHSVKDHLASVAELCEEYGSEFGLGSLTKLAGYLHDMGKYGEQFQKYITSKMLSIVSDEDVYTNSEEKVDHGRIGAKYIFTVFHNSPGIMERVTAEILALVICYHHGGLADCITMDCRVPLIDRLRLEELDGDYNQCVDIFFKEICTEEEINTLFKHACEEIRTYMYQIKQNHLSATFTLHLLIKLIYSILIDSDRYDTYLFMEKKVKDLPIKTEVLWRQYEIRLEEKLEEFRSKQTSKPLEQRIKALRLDVSDTCYQFASRERGIYILTVPTGGGKTLSSLRYAIHHALIKKMERIIYVLPYTTIIEQNASVVRDVLQCDENLLEHHSNIINTEHEKYKLLVQRWDCPIIFTTMVQFLNTFFESGTTSLRRLHHLNKAVIIFDEIQTLPIKCISIFNDTINYLNRMNRCTVILSSATQPNLSETKRPILLSNEPQMIQRATELFHSFKRMNIIPRLIGGGYTYEMIVKLIYALRASNKSILFIMNTKQTAENMYQALINSEEQDDAVIYLLSTNLCPAHRKQIINEIYSRLEKKEPVICISTQLIEAGVDISFETVIRSLAGLDSIAQASGRGNRHGEGQIGNTYIVNIKDESLRKLKEIELGQKHVRSILHEFNECPEKYSNDLLSPEAILAYYRYFYNDNEINTQMDYSISELNENLYSILSGLEKKKMAYKDTNGEPFPLQLSHMFKTAAEHFSVIDNKTRTVLVPYGMGKEIISDLIGQNSLTKKLSSLKEAQQYSVNIFEYQYKQLQEENAFVVTSVKGINILREGFYDMNLGVTTKKKLDFLET